MHAGRRSIPERRAIEVATDALEVHPVSGLVDRAEEALVEEIARDARGDAHIAWAEGDAERMRGDVLPSALEVVAEPGDRFQRVLELLVGIETAAKDAVVDGLGTALYVCDQRDDRGLELGEDGLEVVGRQARFGPVEQGVIGPLLESESLRDLDVELDVLLEVRREEA